MPTEPSETSAKTSEGYGKYQNQQYQAKSPAEAIIGATGADVSRTPTQPSPCQ